MKRLATGLVSICGMACSASAQCVNPVWTPDFPTAAAGLTPAGTTLLVFDADGPGPQAQELYVGGYFQSAGSMPGTRGIAKWNGQAWSSVGGGMTGQQFGVDVLCTFDADGPGPGLPALVAAGWFTSAGGVPANRIATWNGNQWSPLSTGMPSTLARIVDMAEWDEDGAGPGLPKLVVTGEISGLPPVTGAEVFILDAGGWTALADPGDIQARCLTVYDEDGAGPQTPRLFLGTRWGVGIMKLVGQTWEVVGGGLNVRSGIYRCDCMTVIDEDGPGPGRSVLWVGGFFNHAGPVQASGIARWNGQEWSTAPQSPAFFGGSVHDIAAVDYTGGGGVPDIYVVLLTTIHRWNPAAGAWSIVGHAEYGEPTLRRVLEPYRRNEPVPSLFVTGQWVDYNGVPAVGLARLRCEGCYANCDGSVVAPRLTGNDFMCFLDRFANGNAYANCDGSTGNPALTANDFQCFANAFAAGCS